MDGQEKRRNTGRRRQKKRGERKVDEVYIERGRTLLSIMADIESLELEMVAIGLWLFQLEREWVFR